MKTFKCLFCEQDVDTAGRNHAYYCAEDSPMVGSPASEYLAYIAELEARLKGARDAAAELFHPDLWGTYDWMEGVEIYAASDKLKEALAEDGES